MSTVTSLTFNAFEENTYLIKDDITNKGIIVDPGCHSENEKQQLIRAIEEQSLDVVAILNTHCHVDHVFGNAFAKATFPEAPLCIHEGELIVLQTYPKFAAMYGLKAESSPKPDKYLQEGSTFSFGDTSLMIFFTPGHSPASVSFYCEEDQYIIGGDVLFYQGIGRTDLPGGSFDRLIKSINDHFLSLPDEVVVYSGHGQPTTIGHERSHNPFLNQ